MVDEETPCWIEVWFVEHVETIRSKFKYPVDNCIKTKKFSCQ